MSKVTDAIRRAVDWLRANPQNHISGKLAVDADGRHCAPNDPKAQCFCMLGRISKELDLGDSPDVNPEFAQMLDSRDIMQVDIYDINDVSIGAGKWSTACPREKLGRPEVLDFVERKLLS